MPRRARVVIPELAHHITQRGNNRQLVFQTADRYRLYLDLLCQYARRHPVQILAYCLMPNHVHPIAVPGTPDALASLLGRVHSEYALASNRAERRTGHLWRNRFFSSPMDQAYTMRAVRYVELNPVRAGLASLPWEWRWSSAHAHVTAGAADPVLDSEWSDYFGGWNFTEWRENLSAALTDEELKRLRRATRTGEPLGSREFVGALERQTGKRLRVLGRGRPRQKPQLPDEPARQAELFRDADAEKQNSSVPFISRQFQLHGKWICPHYAEWIPAAKSQCRNHGHERNDIVKR
jgi:putative transposase